MGFASSATPRTEHSLSRAPSNLKEQARRGLHTGRDARLAQHGGLCAGLQRIHALALQRSRAAIYSSSRAWVWPHSLGPDRPFSSCAPDLPQHGRERALDRRGAGAGGAAVRERRSGGAGCPPSHCCGAGLARSATRPCTMPCPPQKYPLMRSPWQHLVAMGAGAAFATWLVTFEKQTEEELSGGRGLLQRARRFAAPGRGAGRWGRPATCSRRRRGEGGASSLPHAPARAKAALQLHLECHSWAEVAGAGSRCEGRPGALSGPTIALIAVPRCFRLPCSDAQEARGGQRPAAALSVLGGPWSWTVRSAS